MSKTRVYELAKDLGVDSKVLLKMINDMGEFVRSASSIIEPPVEDRIRQRIAGTRSAAIVAKREVTPEATVQPIPGIPLAAPWATDYGNLDQAAGPAGDAALLRLLQGEPCKRVASTRPQRGRPRPKPRPSAWQPPTPAAAHPDLLMDDYERVVYNAGGVRLLKDVEAQAAAWQATELPVRVIENWLSWADRPLDPAVVKRMVEAGFTAKIAFRESRTSVSDRRTQQPYLLVAKRNIDPVAVMKMIRQAKSA